MIYKVIRQDAPGTRTSLAVGAASSKVYSSPDGWTMIRIFGDELKEHRLIHLKIYSEKKNVVFSFKSENIGI